MAATFTAAAVETIRRKRAPESGPQPKKHRARNIGLAAVALTGGWVIADKTNVGRSIEHGIEKFVGGEIDKGLHAMGGWLNHLFDFKAAPPHAVSSVDQQASTFQNVVYLTGGKVNGFVDSYAEHGHHTGGETFHKLLPFDALIGANAGQVVEQVKLDWDVKTTSYSNGTNKVSKTLKQVEVPLPQAEIISPRLLFDTAAMYAPLRAGMSPQKIQQTIAKYEAQAAAAKANGGKHAPTPDDGISMHRSAWFAGLTGTVNNVDAEVPQLGYTTAQIALALDAYNPYDQRVQGLIQQTDDGLLQYVRGQYPNVPVVGEPTAKTTIAQTIEQRYLTESPNLGNLAATAYFTTANVKDSYDMPQSLEFVMRLPDGVHSQVNFGDVKMTAAQVNQLDQTLGLTIPQK